MGRRPATDDNDVSLFPFLSILACVIGVLTLMISALALMQMDDDVVVRAEEYDSTIAELDRQRASHSALERQLADRRDQLDSEVSSKQKTLVARQAEIKKIQNQYSLATKKRDEILAAMDPGKVLEQEPLAELEKEWAGLKEQAAQLSLALEEKKGPPRKPRSPWSRVAAGVESNLFLLNAPRTGWCCIRQEHPSWFAPET